MKFFISECVHVVGRLTNAHKMARTLTLLLLAVFLQPEQAAAANSDFQESYLFDDWYNGGDYVLFTCTYFDRRGWDEGFVRDGGLAVYASKDDGASWTIIFQVRANSSGARDVENYWNGTKYHDAWCDDGNYDRIRVRWNLPLQWRNCNLKFKSEGWWSENDGTDQLLKSKVIGHYPVGYRFDVRSIEWNGGFYIDENGNMTVPYYFGGGCNTDGETHICTNINGSYNDAIGYRYLAGNYAAGSYSFNLNSIGKNMRSQFTIQPYHEFTHNNDKDARNGVKYYTNSASTKTFYPMPLASLENPVFSQASKSVTLKWKADNSNYGNGRWAIYRNGKFLKVVPQSTYSYTDHGFLDESNVKYYICYVANGWADTAIRSELMSNEVSVNTTRTVPVNNFNADSQDDRIVFTWTSDGYPTAMNHKFKIYIDNVLAYTLMPSDGQTSFRWEHRTTDAHSDRQNKMDGTIPYTEEPLNACAPHNYRVEGLIGETVLNNSNPVKTAIGTGTLFYSFDATKGVYPGTVKLQWHVNRQGSTAAKTYIVDRRCAEKDSDPWTNLYRTSSTDEYLFYTDDTPLPGVFYEYRVTVFDKCDDGKEKEKPAYDIGFAQTTGTMSGRITFGSTGNSVANVDVEARRTGASDDDNAQYHAMRFTSTGGAVMWNYPSLDYAAKKFSKNDFSMQMWLNPETLGEAKILRLNNETCYVGMDANGKLILVNNGQTYTFDNAELTAGQYNHVVLTRSGQNVTASVVGSDEAGVPMLNSSTQTLSDSLVLQGADTLKLGHFVGYVDEFRIWTKALTEDEILENYDHLLVGNEKNLETYWTFDEGLSLQFFDYSRDGTVYRQHHGKTGSNAGPSNLTPEQLKLKARTDRDGNYIIQGVPFRGEGTTYAVIPQLGIHQFNPSQQLRFVGNNSLVHNGTDFTDISSFPVRGTVRYANTDYPVEGVNFYVDGQICAKEGQPIATNAYGEYEISVPIGEHYITVKKQGHVFANDGRYPADSLKVGTLVNYNDAVKNLDFEDVTLVTVAGRVTGGKIEEEKPLGFGESVNNIGQATITLGIESSYRLNVVREVNGTTVSYENNKNDLAVKSPTADVQSETVRQGGDIDAVKNIIIKTDPRTGEFAALLPPIDYSVKSIEIESNPDIIFDHLPILYANDPMDIDTDSLILEDGTKKEFEYVAKLIQSYYSEPVLEVTQQDRNDGSFGEETYTYTDTKTGEETQLTLYTVNEGAEAPTYTYDFPIFNQMKRYTFNVRGYETYVNKDGETPVIYEVPLQNVPVQFSNQMGTGQGVVMDPSKTEEADDQQGDLSGDPVPDELTLDENGKGQYQWQAGFPNITAPYTLNLAATFTHNGKGYTWKGINTTNSLTGVVIGALPTGSNFVTSGPDKVEMIIRDPAGSASSAFWETGQSVTMTETQNITVNEELETMTHTEFGVELTTLTAANAGVVILGLIETNKTKATLDVGVTTEYEHVSSDTRVLTTSTTKRISTSGESEYVGAQGDVFVGQSTNIVFGNARTVGFQKNGTTGSIELQKFDNYVTGQEFETHFNYTQNHIENVLIPNLIALRNDVLRKGVDEQGLIYDTTLNEDDEKFGTAGTYTVTLPQPADKPFYTDMVKYYNEQIANWEFQMARNEEAKVTVISDRRRWLEANQSFDSGTFIDSEVSSESTVGTSTTNTFNTSLIVGGGTSVSVFGQDVDISLQSTTKAGSEWEKSNENTRSITTGYSLVETGDDDALSVDVYRAPDGMGAIFVTRGGQTTCPYEGEQRTKYFEPGKHVLATATQQIEKPRIRVENGANRLVGVPAGKMANFPLLLTNESETGEDCYFVLFVIDDTNKKGAGIDINSNELSDGRRVLVPAGKTVRMNLELEQNNAGDLLYENIAVVLASDCQSDPSSTWDVIGDTVYISAEFVPSSTDVTLRIDNTVVNTSTKGILPLTVRDYDPYYDGLKYIAVQYQGVGETMWHDARKYVMKDSAIVNPQIEEVLPISGVINLNFDMNNNALFPDRTYKFRAISARTYGNGEVTNVSQEILVVKDMSRPKPLGQPQPTDGILQAGDDLSILFNEAILNGELTKDANFRITGVLNGSAVDHQTALALQNTVQTAATEASINLAGKDFSIDTWVNTNGAGTLLTHGTGTQKLTVSIDDDNKLVVKVGDQTYTSLADMPQNKWAFLTLSLTADGKLSASVAAGSETTTLFSNKEAIAYEGNGPLSVGQQMTGAMHELLLWDEARDITTALQQRSVTKNPATKGLIGYWKMNEGEGTLITDYARNRHMAMSDETWHIENENKAVALDGEHFVGINTSEIPPMPQDDYAVELWVKAGEQTADAQLLQLGEVGLVIDAEGQLSLESNNSSLFTLNSSLTDNAWHHVALNVLRGGNANLYIDGEAKATVNADRVGSLGSDRLIIGARRTLQDVEESEVLYTYDRPLTATIDEVRIWNASMNANLLKKQRKLRLTGEEPGLVAYYPFEVKTLDQQNQVITNGDDADLCGSGKQAQFSPLSSQFSPLTSQFSPLTYTNDAPALREKPSEENVNFTFTASDKQIVITLDEEAARLEGTTLNITVRDVHDQNGNLSEPVTWTAFISQNPLAWQESTVGCTAKVTEGATLTATLVNKSGVAQSWTLSGLPTWLTADVDYGLLQPLAEQVITLNVSSSTPIGKYERNIYVKGDDGIETPLTLNIKVMGNTPDWTVNPHDFETSMNVIGVLKKDGAYMTDADDMMAAFIGDECRGVANLKYNERYGNYYVTMDIYGGTAETGQEVSFRAYDASTGTTYPVVKWESDKPFKFLPLTLQGTYAEPAVFNIQDLIEQELDLKAGWNWISFNVEADDMTAPALFEKIVDDVIVVKGHSSSLTPEENSWNGKLTESLSTAQMYAVKMKTDRKLRVVGTSANTPVSIHAGWNWLGYQGQQVASLGDALADMEKTDGDVVKAQSGVAYWDSYEWSGSLMMMEPGVGYQLKSTAADQTFNYPSTVATGVRMTRAVENTSLFPLPSSLFSPVNFRNYPDNAIMAVKVMAGKTLAGVEVAAFAGDECRTVAVTDERGIAYLTIPGDENCELTFKVAVDGKVVDAPLTLTYENDAIYGTPKHPLVMNLSDTDGIREIFNDNGVETIYDLGGRKIQSDNQSRKLKKGVYIINGKKQTVK
ncbi:LamG domain-containing protein [Prevotella sp. E9-3]|uniref:LamG domain-containing protein n=1 Tax=Prevotella sp. E9-3 TaxID=2913621 RepID=UPI001EDC4182|nr:LamG domain-containing protein [Prevotella sp. E9-3]UKK48446.1 LamG domain-containing protein [Prevotella sp. E9-3]